MCRIASKLSVVRRTFGEWMDLRSGSGECQLQAMWRLALDCSHLQDNSDAQFRYFRNNIPVLTALASIFFVLKVLYQRIFVRSDLSKGDTLHRIPFLFLFSILLMLGLHGANILKIFLILTMNFGIAKVFGSSRINPLLTWVFNMGVLIAIERNSGYRFASISPALANLVRFIINPERIAIDVLYVRTACKDSILAGSSLSISQCCDSSHSTLTIIGRAGKSAQSM